MAREMNDSGIAWVGEIPSEWHIEKHKYLFSCGKEIVGTSSKSTQLLSLTTQGVKKKSSDAVGGKLPESFDTYQIVEENNLIMCLFDLDCSAVFSGLSPFCGMISPAYKVLKCSAKILPKFADYWFKFVFDGRKFKSYAKNLRYTLNYDEFSCIPMALPNLEEQLRIAMFLDRKCAEIDSVIADTQRTIEEYKKLKQSVITQAVTKGIRGERPMKDSGIAWIGEIPEDWNLGKVKYCTTKIGSGKTPKGGAEVYTDSGVLFLRSQNVYNEGLLLDSPTYITNEVDEDMASTRVQANDILLNITGGSIGRSCIFPAEHLPANVNQHVSIIRVQQDKVLPGIMHYFWISRIGQLAIDLYQTGGNREGMSGDAIANTPFMYYSLDEQHEILMYLDEKCVEFDHLIQAKQQFLTELESYKKSVIYEYVTGKKEVPTCQ